MAKHSKSKEELLQEARQKENQARIDAENTRLRDISRTKLLPLVQVLGNPTEVERLTQWFEVLTQQAHMRMIQEITMGDLGLLEGLPEDDEDVKKMKAILDIVQGEKINAANEVVTALGKEIKAAKSRLTKDATWDELDIQVLDAPEKA